MKTWPKMPEEHLQWKEQMSGFGAHCDAVWDSFWKKKRIEYGTPEKKFRCEIPDPYGLVAECFIYALNASHAEWKAMQIRNGRTIDGITVSELEFRSLGKKVFETIAVHPVE